jgi:hypothetical protein
MRDLVQAMVQRRLTFMVECNEPGGPVGTLYLWAVDMPNIGQSLLGVFRPTPPSPRLNPKAGLIF